MVFLHIQVLQIRKLWAVPEASASRMYCYRRNYPTWSLVKCLELGAAPRRAEVIQRNEGHQALRCLEGEPEIIIPAIADPNFPHVVKNSGITP